MSRTRGAALTEFIIVTALALAPLSLGTLQVALIHNARRVVDYATFEAARDGALHHAQKAPMREAFTRNVLALYGGGTDAAKLLVSRGLAEADLAAPAAPRQRIGAGFQIAIQNPAKEAFDDFGMSVKVGNQTIREIPNDHLRYRSRDVGPASAVNIQDANLLKIEVTYGYKMVVPVINTLTAAVLRKLDPVNSNYYSADPPRLPIKSVALVRMHSPARADGNLSVQAGLAGEGGNAGAVPPLNPPVGEPPPGDGSSSDAGGGPTECIGAFCEPVPGDFCPGVTPVTNPFNTAGQAAGGGTLTKPRPSRI